MCRYHYLLIILFGCIGSTVRHSCCVEAFRQPYVCSSIMHGVFASLSRAEEQSARDAQPESTNFQQTRVYHPKTKSEGKSNFAGKLAGRNSNTLALSSPQLLVRYRVPKFKSDVKVVLESLQTTFAPQSEYSAGTGVGMSADSARTAPTSPKQYQSRNLPASDSTRQAPAIRSGTHSSSPAGNLGKGISYRSKGGAASKEAERSSSKGSSEGRQHKPSSDFSDGGRRAQRQQKDDEDDTPQTSFDSVYDGADNVPGLDELFGDERLASLKALPHGVLATLDQDLSSLEDIQLALYGEYGIKASISAIKRRLDEDKFDKRKRTGKTKREKAKARSGARNLVQEAAVSLPEHGVFSISDLATQLRVPVGETLRYLMMNEGLLLSINHSISVEIARKVAAAFGKSVVAQKVERNLVSAFALGPSLWEDESPPYVRSPVVAVMGHVDHGKTSLLDKIRSTKVALGEAGGITQTLSAFQVTSADAGNRTITFVDTPGHAAFRAMRERGANVTDIMVLVVAADDGVMEQTKECIAAARSTECPVVVAITKIDKEGADAESVKLQLMREGVVVEELGGDCQCCAVSSVSGTGISELLEKINLQAEVMDLSTRLNGTVDGTVLEARKDKGLGVVVTAVLRTGTLRVGDIAVAGSSWGRVRRLMSDTGVSVQAALPSEPVQIVGMSALPSVGDALSVVDNEGDAQDVTAARSRLSKQNQATITTTAARSGAATIIAEMSANAPKKVTKLPVLIKCDNGGSVEAILSALPSVRYVTDTEVGVADVVYASVGDITTSDVAVAAASGAIIFAFGVSCTPNSADNARSRDVVIGSHDVIYDLLDDLGKKIKQKVSPHSMMGHTIGRLLVKKVFSIGKGGKVAGCVVNEGTAISSCNARVFRGNSNVPVFVGEIASLKVAKDVVKEVMIGLECGVSLSDWSLFEEGDIIECFLSSK